MILCSFNRIHTKKCWIRDLFHLGRKQADDDAISNSYWRFWGMTSNDDDFLIELWYHETETWVTQNLENDVMKSCDENQTQIGFWQYETAFYNVHFSKNITAVSYVMPIGRKWQKMTYMVSIL